MRRIFLMSSVLFVAPFTFGEMGEVSAQCVATTDCASLGYTEASCPNGGIKCPFGNTWSCKGTEQLNHLVIPHTNIPVPEQIKSREQTAAMASTNLVNAPPDMNGKMVCVAKKK